MGTICEKVAVVCGGTSAEKDASRANAERICMALKALGHRAELVDYDSDIVENLKKRKPSCVFLCVQGKGHGDGTMQAICDHLGISYTGSRMTAAAVINDKRLCKDLCRLNGIRTPEYRSLRRSRFLKMDQEELYDFIEPLGFPVVAKGVTQGGSYGIGLIRSREDLEMLGGLYEYDDELLFEAFIDGRFLTVSLLERDGTVEALPVLEGSNREKGDMILFDRPFDVRRAEITPELEQELKESALRLFDIYGARSYGRVDYMLDRQGTAWFLEMNAVPGMREESFYPVAASLAGIGFEELAGVILENR